MRTLLLALMIALLPIRGWLGDAMALEMVRHSLHASPAASSQAATAATAASTVADAHCHEAMEAATAGDGMDTTMAHHAGTQGDSTSHGTDHQGCGTCTACQVCHTVALGGMPMADIVHGAPQAPPPAHAARFASAEAALGLKPPIS